MCHPLFQVGVFFVKVNVLKNCLNVKSTFFPLLEKKEKVKIL